MANIGTPKRTIVAINASGGAQKVISASIFCGYAEVTECPPATYAGGAFTGQGLLYQRADENYANTYPLTPGQILQVGDAIRKEHSEGIPGFTYPDGSTRPATPWFKIISATATPTQVMVTEWRELQSA
jgi:hypothetical protein